MKAAPPSVGGPLLRKAPPPSVASGEPPVKAAPAAGEQLLRKAPPPGVGAERTPAKAPPQPHQAADEGLPPAKAAPPGVGGWSLSGGEPAVKAPPCSAEAPAACGASEAPPAGVVS